MHAALGGATSGRQRLRVFVPHDFGLQTIRVAEEDAQGGAEVSNGAIRGAYVHEPGARVLEGLPAPGIEAKMVETAAPKHGGLDLGLGIARHLEDIERTLTTQPFPLIALQPPAVRLTQGSVNDFIIDFDQRRGEARATPT